MYQDVIACDVINPDDIDVEFNSIGGLETIKQALFKLVILCVFFYWGLDFVVNLFLGAI